MKAREGFISIICLIVMPVLMIMILYLEHTTRLGSLILRSTENNIQSYYSAEGKIYMTLHEEKYYSDQLYPALAEYFRALPFSKQPKDITINREDLKLGDELDKVRVILVDKDNKKELQLVAKSNFNGLITTVISYIELINEIFEAENPILDVNSIENKYKEDLMDLLLKISKDININNCNKPENIYGMESLNFNHITLDKKDNTYFEIISFRESMTLPYIERFNNKEVFIIIREFGENPVDFYIGNLNTPRETIKLSGLIYIEGNITISKDFEFTGIIIARDGEIKIDENIRTNIKGIMITNNIINNDFIERDDIIYSRHSVYKYGTYLPGFIEPKLYLIKSD
ncbi:hypothetical protein NE686_00830 [Tissierella carlieri]|uniref:Uncharacterized protein n=1 Tax=Tissierella carlieri TaxID=689904 RepID=A0ABT1S571_9FIRM|nr:hypothetical protein [Tissierella carlieri]MCQ4921613.1 hypothetical protein [Tissierella carlieri]